MTSQQLPGSSAPQLDAHLYGIRNEFDRLNRELDEAKKQRDEYKTNYWNKDKELRELIALFFHRRNGKDQICQCCKGEISHTAGLADDNPSISPAPPSSEYYSPLEENEIVPAPLDNTGNSIEISPIDGDVRLGEGAISVENEASTSSPPLGSLINSAKNVGKSTWNIEYNDDTEISLKLDLVHELKPEGTTRVAFCPNGKYLATASSVGIVCIFDASTGERISVMRDLYQKPDEDVFYSCLSFSPDNNYLATGGWDGKVRIWIISQRRVRNLFWVVGNIRDLDFSPNGKHLVTSAFDEPVRIWRLRDGYSRVLTGGEYTPWAVRFSPDGRYVASGYDPNQIVIWNVRTGSLLARWEAHDAVTSLSFTPDAKGLLCSSWDKGLILWDVAWLFSPGITLYDAESRQDVNSTVTEVLRFVGHADCVYIVSISPDGKWIGSGSLDRTVRIWNAQDATLQCTLHGPSKIYSIAFSPVGTYLAIGGHSEVPVTIWNYANLS